MRCPRCHLAAIPEGTRTCVRCGYSPAGLRAAPGVVPVADAPDAQASGEPSEARRPEWFQMKRRSGPAPPVVILDDGNEDVDDEDDRDWSPPPPRRLGPRVLAAVGVTIALGSGAVWLNTSGLPAPIASPDVVGPASATPPVATPPPPDTALPRARLPAASPAPPPAQPRASVAAAPWRRAQPPVVTRPVTPRRTAPPPSRGARAAEPALVSINATPWGSVYIDGQPVGNTPQIDRHVSPGSHELRVEREGFRPYQRVIDVAPGQRLRITDITLVER
jgi:hypothetical protein